MMKQVISAILALVMTALLFTACGAEDPSHTVYYKDSRKSEKVVATFFNSDANETEEVEMEKVGEDDDSFTFSCVGDTSVYNMVYFTCDDQQVTTIFQKVAFNKCVSGWYKTEDDLLPYTEGKKIDYTPTFDVVTLSGCGEDKKVYIWTPDDYDENAGEKYATIYVLDGQGFMYTGQEGQKLKGCPVLSEQVEAMSAVTGKKAIVVGIESDVERNYEYVPEIGESADEKHFKESNDTEFNDEFEGMNGTQFADFVANTLVSYVQEHYNVYTDALHTSVTGGSLGGLESFYIAVEYPDVFGTAGAMSPSFWEYDDATWNKYLGEKSFDKSSPFLYFYTGGEQDVGPFPVEMVDRLKALGYPEERIALHYNEEGVHDSTIWRNMYAEFLTAMVYQLIEPLQKEKDSNS